MVRRAAAVATGRAARATSRPRTAPPSRPSSSSSISPTTATAACTGGWAGAADRCSRRASRWRRSTPRFSRLPAGASRSGGRPDIRRRHLAAFPAICRPASSSQVKTDASIQQTFGPHPTHHDGARRRGPGAHRHPSGAFRRQGAQGRPRRRHARHRPGVQHRGLRGLSRLSRLRSALRARFARQAAAPDGRQLAGLRQPQGLDVPPAQRPEIP